MEKYPILDFDKTPEAIINPPKVEGVSLWENCVLCFFQDVIEDMEEKGELELVYWRNTEMGIKKFYNVKGKKVSLVHPGVGASYAAMMMERSIAMGAKRFIGCGGTGVIDQEFPLGHLLVPTRAIRDEGTSYHYLEPETYVDLSPSMVTSITSLLEEEGLCYNLVTTWTTDGFYRETRDRLNLRLSQGAACVDMEASALAAVAKFRGVEYGHLFYSGDNLAAKNYENRKWMSVKDIRRNLLDLAIKAAER